MAFAAFGLGGFWLSWLLLALEAFLWLLLALAITTSTVYLFTILCLLQITVAPTPASTRTVATTSTTTTAATTDIHSVPTSAEKLRHQSAKVKCTKVLQIALTLCKFAFHSFQPCARSLEFQRKNANLKPILAFFDINFQPCQQFDIHSLQLSVRSWEIQGHKHQSNANIMTILLF